MTTSAETSNHTIASILANAAKQWPTKIAIVDSDTLLTFSELEQKAKQMAAAMLAQGLKSGDRFAIWAPNIHEWVWTALGGLLAGGTMVPLNTRYKGIEAGDILRRSQARILFTTCGFLDTNYPALLNDEALHDLDKIVLLRGEEEGLESLSEFLAAAKKTHELELDRRLSALTPDAISDIMYTSGTTGAPKGVLSSHAQTVNIFKIWSNTVGLSNEDKYLIINPFFHSFGYKAGWLSCLITGATAYPVAVFKPLDCLQMIEQHRITMLPGAPTIFQTILNEPSLNERDLTSLRRAVTGAASVPEQLVHDMRHLLGFDEVFTAYGLTECPVVSITQAGDAIDIIANTAGCAIAGTEIAITDARGHPVAANRIGDIKVRGYNVMQGYFEDEAATSKTISNDGWLDTGDVGWKDEKGYIKVTDRAKDMYICGGFNCYPAEIENLLLRHPEIVDVAVVGMPEERLGEVGQAYIVCQNKNLTYDELNSWAREHMANFKVPRQFIRVPELPRNASGKVQKFRLAEHPATKVL